MYITRHLETQILEASKYYPVVMVCGQRQVGKSKLDIQPGIILCMSDELLPYNRESWYCPVSVL